MKLLVTGSAGLIGARLCEVLENSGVSIVPFDLRQGSRDIRDAAAVRDAIAGCDGVIHLAAVSRVAWGEADPELCDSVNVAGTASVIDAALRSDRRPWFVLASSREVYGRLDTVPAREDAPLHPLNAYGRSKLASEQLVAAARAKGLRTATLRFSNVYGAVNDHPDRAVPSLLWRAMTGQPLTISGAETFFDFVHVDDCVRGLKAAVALLDSGNLLPTLHLVSGVATSLGQLAGLVLDVASSRSALMVEAGRSFDVPGFVGDPALARTVLNWRAEMSLRQGIEALQDTLRLHGRPMDQVEMPPVPDSVSAAAAAAKAALHPD